LIKPALYATAVAAFTVCNAYGKGDSLENAAKKPIQLAFRGGEAIVHQYKQYANAAPKAEGSEGNSSQASMIQKAKDLGSRLLIENIYAFKGAKKLFIKVGGQPEALLMGIGVNQTMMLLEDTGYIIDPGLASAALSTGLAATAALVATIYGTEAPLQPPSEKEEDRSLDKQLDPLKPA
jgi:hypothetical protein